jgi:hypothetical protein
LKALNDCLIHSPSVGGVTMSKEQTRDNPNGGLTPASDDDQLLIDLHREVLALMRCIAGRYLPTIQIAAWAGQVEAANLCVNLARAVHEEQTHCTLQSQESEWRYYSDGSLAGIAHWARAALRSRSPELAARLDDQIEAFRSEQLADSSPSQP